MARAKIIARLARSRYRIELDYGSDYKADRLAWLNQQLVDVQAEIDAMVLLIADADAAQADQLAVVDAALAAYIAAVQAGDEPDLKAYTEALRALRTLQAKHQELRTQKAVIDTRRANLLRQVAALNQFEPVVQRDVWLPAWEGSGVWDYPMHAAGDIVDVWPINGEPDHYVVGTRWKTTPITTQMRARETMTPAQAFSNAARLPGWQKWRPTYRWGVVTAVHIDAVALDVTLAPALSSAQHLPINVPTELVNVPLLYDQQAPDGGQASRIRAFAPGDRVVVEFTGMDWAQPVVRGFLENPVRGGTLLSFYYAETRVLTLTGSPPPPFSEPQLESVWLTRDNPAITLSARTISDQGWGLFRTGVHAGLHAVTFAYTDLHAGNPYNITAFYRRYATWDKPRFHGTLAVLLDAEVPATWLMPMPHSTTFSDPYGYLLVKFIDVVYTYSDGSTLKIMNYVQDQWYEVGQVWDMYRFPFDVVARLSLVHGRDIDIAFDVYGQQVSQSSWDYY